jgi:hypothetical protein
MIGPWPAPIGAQILTLPASSPVGVSWMLVLIVGVPAWIIAAASVLLWWKTERRRRQAGPVRSQSPRRVLASAPPARRDR